MKLFKSCEDGVHKFEGRYNEAFNKSMVDRLASIRGGIMDGLREKTYIHDICVRCGKIINIK